MLTPMAKKLGNRYFRVTYYCMTVHGQEGWGSIGAIAPNGRYVIDSEITNKVCEIQDKMMPERPMAQVMITNIIEMTESDYKDFYGQDAKPGEFELTFSQN